MSRPLRIPFASPGRNRWGEFVRPVHVAAVLCLGAVSLSATACNVDWSRVWATFQPKKAAPASSPKPATAASGTPTRIPPIVDDAPHTTPGELNLGTARFPANAPTGHAIHDFTAPTLAPSRYQLTFIVDAQTQASLESSYQTYAKSVGAVGLGATAYQWDPPPGCAGDTGCVMQALADEDHDALVPIIALFAARQKAARLNATQLAALVVSFVQDIPYKIPDTEPFGFLAPALVVSRKVGDCECKALLAHLILRALGYDTVFITSDAHHHAMLGIALPVSGDRFVYQGRQYGYTELTAPGAPIGWQSPEVKTPNDWRVVTLRHPSK
jgi:hypothetical protein